MQMKEQDQINKEEIGKLLEKEFRIMTVKMILGFPNSSVGKESACNVGDLGSISEFGRSPGEGKGYPIQYSGLENSVHRGTW